MGSINKVIFGSDTLIDLTEDTVSPETLGKGVTAHDKSGVPIVGTMESGGSLPPATKKEVNFYDYDGTILYSYTVAEAAALTELPALPSHDGLICQGWNWTLDSIKAMGRAVDVGATYITDDGKTRVHIRLADGRTSPVLGCSPNGTVTVDWGDGTTPDVLSSTNLPTVVWTPTHEYATPGDYVISLTVDGFMIFYGVIEGSKILRHTNKSDTDKRNKAYQNSVQRIEIGDGVIPFDNGFRYCTSLASIVIPDSVASIMPNFTSFSAYMFLGCSYLASIVIPNGITTINKNTFSHCTSLASVVIPNGVTSIGVEAFSNCTSLASVVIPDSVTSIGNGAFDGCTSLASIVIPNGVTTIENNTFYRCYSVRYYDFTRHTAVPTLSGTDAFNIAADCEIRVPAALADEWKAATNWAAYADCIVGV